MPTVQPADTPDAQARPPRYPRIDPGPEERFRFLHQLAVYLAAMYPGCGSQRRRRLIGRVRR